MRTGDQMLLLAEAEAPCLGTRWVLAIPGFNAIADRENPALYNTVSVSGAL